MSGQRVFFVAFVAALILAIAAFTQQQQAANNARMAEATRDSMDVLRGQAISEAQQAQTKQFQAESNATVAMGAAQVAATGQAVAQATQTVAVAYAAIAVTGQVHAEMMEATAVGNANAAATAQANAENGQATQAMSAKQSAATATQASGRTDSMQATADAFIATGNARINGAQATSDADVAHRQTQVSDFQATDQAFVATGNAQIDSARSTSVAVGRIALTQQARSDSLEATVAVLQATADSAVFGETTPRPTTVGVVPTSTPVVDLGAQPTETFVPVTELPSSEALPLSEEFTSKDGNTKIGYPTGWVVQEGNGPVLFFGNSADSFSQVGASGGFVGFIAPIDASQTNNASLTDVGSQVGANFLNSVGLDAVTFDSQTELFINGQHSGRVMGRSSHFEMVVIVIDPGTGFYILVGGLSAPGEIGQYEATFIAMSQTYEFKAP